MAFRLFLALAVSCPAGFGQSPEQRIEALEKQNAELRRILIDWAGLTRYGSENTEIRPPAPGEQRVVFLGDEITEYWGRGAAKFFPGKPYFNRGIARQTTPQMLVRFRQDVILLKPKAVVIHAGTNDIAAVMGPATQGTLAENIMSMVELAKANNIRVVLASVLPVCDCRGVVQARLRPAGKILGLNEWLKEYATSSHAIYLDYHSLMSEGRALKTSLTADGFLPNEPGYEAMALLADRAIALALRN